MSLVNMKEVLKQAEKEGYAIGAFNTLSLEAVKGAIRAAEDLRSPIILQLAQVQLDGTPMHLMAPLMVAAAKKASVPVVVHFDHGEDVEHIIEALELGFSSVMFDGASLPLEENIRITKRVKEMADGYNASCEAEIGRVGGSEDGAKELEMMITDVSEAERFVKETNVDALAIAIGNAHGPYKEAPLLQYDRLKEIKYITKIPLVLHGGSGISEDEFRRTIKLGIQKVNVATALQQKVIKELNNLWKDDMIEKEYFTVYQKIEDAIYDEVSKHIKTFMSDFKVRDN